MKNNKRILVIGSGPIVIGQAAEFDYAGTQACKSLKEEGCYVILVNSNPATIMTDVDTADKVYVEPLTIEIIEKIIIKEKPDGILGTLGGQTGLNLVKDLYDKKILEKHNVKVLGTSVESINKAEDRLLFRNLMNELGEPVPPSFSCNTIDEAVDAAKKISYPVIIRPAFTLGGTGGGVAYNEEELKKISYSGINASMVGQILVEKCLVGWKEVEYEVIRDSDDNAITVCNMENFDPMGVHTGDSIVVAPSQTLSDKDYQELRTSSLNIIKGLKIEGGCNVQLAFRPYDSKDYEGPNYYVIEVNPRVSRSSALASKATGYPIARVAAKIALGKKLDEISNQVTGVTIGTQMKATGEVMSIERNFESALLKAIRALDISNISHLNDKSIVANDVSDLIADDTRLFKILKLLRNGFDLEDIYNFTKIDKWFLVKLKKIVDQEKKLISAKEIDKDILKASKKIGFSDESISFLTKKSVDEIRILRKKWSILPTYKMVDTCASEFEALTPYYYSTYETENEAIPDNTNKAVVLGSGPIRIGQGIEFDYCSVHAAWSLQKRKIDSIFINSNPETVSTDFDTSDRLYFEPIDQESVFDILENEGTRNSFPSTIVQFGGQTAINLTKNLEKVKYPISGTSAKSTELASDRGYFEELTSSIGVPQPPAGTSLNFEEAKKIAKKINYPVIVRPSFVLGGMAMNIIDNEDDLKSYFEEHDFSNLINPEILIDKYIEGIELEIDAISDGRDILIPGIMMHLEKAGVHSGDSVAVYPAKGITDQEKNIILEYSKKIAQKIKIVGLMNIQFILDRSDKNSKVYVIEVNPRSSRTVPFISKATGIPMIDLAVGCMQGEKLINSKFGTGIFKERNITAVKAPVFSMSKLTDVDTFLGPEMKSTGEVMGISKNYEEAISKAFLSSGINIPSNGSVLLSIANRDKDKAKYLIKLIHGKGYNLIATPGTAKLIIDLGFSAQVIEKSLDKNPNVIDKLRSPEVIAVVNTVSGDSKTLHDGFKIRRESSERKIPCFTSLDTAEAVFKDEVKENKLTVNSLDEYLRF